MVSPLAQEQVYDPAASHMPTQLAAVGEDVGVVAASFFKGIRQVRHPLEPALRNGIFLARGGACR